MQEMGTLQKKFNEKIEALLKEFTPKDECADIIAREILTVFADTIMDSGLSAEDIFSELESMSKVSGVEKDLYSEMFKKTLRDTVLFTAQNIMYDSLKNAFLNVRYSVPLVERRDAKLSGVYKVDTSITSNNEVSFDDMDIDSIPKVTQETLRSLRGSSVDVTKTGKRKVSSIDSNEFDGVDIQGEYGVSRNHKDSFIQDFREDASKFTGQYDSVPNISVDIDY